MEKTETGIVEDMYKRYVVIFPEIIFTNENLGKRDLNIEANLFVSRRGNVFYF